MSGSKGTSLVNWMIYETCLYGLFKYKRTAATHPLTHLLPMHPALSPSEQNYSQIEKEALSLVFGLCRLHQYVYGQPVSNSKNAKVGITFLISFWYTIQMYTAMVMVCSDCPWTVFLTLLSAPTPLNKSKLYRLHVTKLQRKHNVALY